MARRVGCVVKVLVALVALLALGTTGVGATASEPARTRPLVIVYGDSLTSQSKPEIQARLSKLRPGWRMIIRAQGGSAICDWLPAMRDDAALRPRIVVLQFSGNIRTPCILDRATAEGSAWQRSYAHDAATAAAMWANQGATVVIVGNPRPYTQPTLTRGPHPLDATYKRVARRVARTVGRVIFNDRPELAVAEPDPTDPAKIVFPGALPCLPGEVARPECRGGSIQVRDAGGGHFCPVAKPDEQPCPVYSSGIVRFGDAIASAVIASSGG